ncbi:hypothetical protein BGZ94_001652 [Podila epigama]|nr:hypothetical protein BGZ94_001652 [Podila epigama]
MQKTGTTTTAADADSQKNAQAIGAHAPKSPTKTSAVPISSSSFASEKRKAIHEKAKLNQRNIIEGKGNKSALSFMYRHQIVLLSLL